MNRVMYREWFPQIMYNHHQTGPAGTVMFAPPFRDPFNYNFDPLDPDRARPGRRARCTRASPRKGKPGVTMRTGSSYSTWWNGGLRTTAYFHNMIGLLTETIGNPTPMTIPFVPDAAAAATATCRIPIAPQAWHFRQSIDYSMTANRAMLDSRRATARTCCTTSTRWGRTRSSAAAATAGRRRRAGSIAAQARERPRAAVAAAPSGDEPIAAAAAARRPAHAEQFKTLLRDPGDARSARLHHPVGSARLPDRDEVRQRAAQDRRHRASRDGAVHGRPARTIRPARTS